jgi:hypothetical protein
MISTSRAIDQRCSDTTRGLLAGLIAGPGADTGTGAPHRGVVVTAGLVPVVAAGVVAGTGTTGTTTLRTGRSRVLGGGGASVVGGVLMVAGVGWVAGGVVVVGGGGGSVGVGGQGGSSMHQVGGGPIDNRQLGGAGQFAGASPRSVAEAAAFG